MVTDKEMEEAGLGYAHSQLENDKSITGSNSASLLAFKIDHGFQAGAKWMQEKMKEALRNEVTLETVSCDCHLFKNQVCDFCQGIKLYAHIKKPDNAVLK